MSTQVQPREVIIPNNVRKQLSDTSKAEDCFIGQQFSQKLQAFLVGYVNNIYSNYSVYK